MSQTTTSNRRSRERASPSSALAAASTVAPAPRAPRPPLRAHPGRRRSPAPAIQAAGGGESAAAPRDRRRGASGSVTVNVAPGRGRRSRRGSARRAPASLADDGEAEARARRAAASSSRRPGGSDRRRAAGTPAAMPTPLSRTVELARRPRRRQRHVDASALRRELHGVREQVPDDLLQPVGVADHAHARASMSALDRRSAWPARRRPDRRRSPLDDGREVDRRDVEPQLAGDDARDVEEVLDEAHLRAGVALDAAERALARLRRSSGAARRICEPAEDRVERRAQLVRQRGEELVLEAVRFLLAAQADRSARARGARPGRPCR